MGTYPRAHRARAVVATGYARGDPNIHLEHEAAAGACVPRGCRPWSRARGFGAACDAQGHAQTEPTFVRGPQARAVQTRSVLQGHRVSLT